MNHPRSRKLRPRHPAFTLVELLVVIGIITILAAVTLQVSNNVIFAAKRAKAANTATQIQTACLSYYTEYSIYPNPTPSATGDSLVTDVAGNNSIWGQLIEALCGNVKPSTGALFTPNNVTNSRSIAFLSMKVSDVDSSDAPLNPVNPAPDATNLYFNIAMDTDYDGILGGTTGSGNTVSKLPNFQSSTPGNIVTGGSSTAGVAIWENCNPKVSSKNPSYWIHTY